MKSILIFTLLFYSLIGLGQKQSGKASFYADKFEGRTTANGEKYRHHLLTAAHKTLPFGTMLKVTNKANNKTVIVRVNDRGPFVAGRIIDLSKSAAEKLDFVKQGLADVTIEVVNPDQEPNESRELPGTPPTVEKEFYELNVKRVNPDGFGVQIGSYQEMANLVRFAENLGNSYRQEVTVQVKMVNSSKMYAVILGSYPTRDKAENWLNKVKKKYPDAFIVQFGNLN